jgi:hypothetical protein
MRSSKCCCAFLIAVPRLAVVCSCATVARVMLPPHVIPPGAHSCAATTKLPCTHCCHMLILMFPVPCQLSSVACLHAGVQSSADGADVASPVSLVEWFLNFYEEASEMPELVEGLVHAGEILFVPRGWWHLAINLEVRPCSSVEQLSINLEPRLSLPPSLVKAAPLLSTTSTAADMYQRHKWASATATDKTGRGPP